MYFGQLGQFGFGSALALSGMLSIFGNADTALAQYVNPNLPTAIGQEGYPSDRTRFNPNQSLGTVRNTLSSGNQRVKPVGSNLGPQQNGGRVRPVPKISPRNLEPNRTVLPGIPVPHFPPIQFPSIPNPFSR